jgi:uncharacterized protein (TIGR02594 family)
MDIKGIQQALKQQGFDPGAIDGVWGRNTIAAVKAFQQARGLEVDGVVGPQTARALGGAAAGPAAAGGGAPQAGAAAASSTPLVWFEEAQHLMGLKEVSGPGSNPTILKWAKDLNIDYDDDDIPWCGLFVAHCVGSTLPGEPLPGNPLGARNWAKFGDHCDPVQGAVLVFWRGSKSGTLGHVGFYQGEDGEAFHVLGGNQSDMVNLTRVGKDRLLDARWPHSAASLRGAKVIAVGQGPLSHNEA